MTNETPPEIGMPQGEAPDTPKGEKRNGGSPDPGGTSPWGLEEKSNEAWVEDLLNDHRQRWHTGEHLTAQEYMDIHPTLKDDEECFAGLIYQEYVMREEGGESPNLEEYFRQFPQYESRLRDLFEADHLVDLLLPPPNNEHHPGDLFGDYELLEEIGRGGMGVVYRARQVNLNRIVALKLIRDQWATDAEVRRFRLEAEAAANLQHANIVAVHEFGAHAGQPYFSMDYVEGHSLAALIRENPLSARKAAEYLHIIAAAIHYAHQQGTLHRDLKPSNVLIDHVGQPRVTDFGLARLIDAESDMTQSGQILGTPSYMPPEQATGRHADVGPASDVYALGAMLYDLLTGRPPFRAATPLETLKQVVDLEPVAPARLNPDVPRDLETICLKCLHKESSRRYASAQKLADDLGRFLAGDLIEARPVSAAERLYRWCRRQPLVSGLAAGLSLVIVVSLIGLTVLWLHAERQGSLAVNNARKEEEQRVRAEQNLQEGRRAVREHFIQLSEIKLNDMPDPSLLRRRQLEAARKYFQEFLAQNPDNPDLLAEVAEAHFRVAQITAEIGSKADAITSYELAREIYVKLVEDEPGDPAFRGFLAGCHGNLGLLHMELRRLDQAEENFKKGLEIQSRLVQENPDERIHREALAQAHINLGTLFRANRRWGLCVAEYKQGQEILEKLAKEYGSQSGYPQQLGRLFNNFGVLFRHQGCLPEAESAYRQAIKIQEDLVHAQPTALGFQSELALSLYNLGFLFSMTGRRDQAEPPYRRAAEYWEQLMRFHPEETRMQHYFARTLGSLALIYRETNRPKEAEREALRALDVQEKLVRANPNVADFVNDLAITYCQMGDLVRDSQALRALDWYTKAIATAENVLKIDKNNSSAGGFLGTFYRARAEVLTDLGRHAEAIQDYDLAIDRIGGRERVLCRFARALSLARVGRHERAAAEAADLTESKDEPQNVLYSAACVYALSAAKVTGDGKLAEKYAGLAVDLLRQAVQKGYRNVEEMKGQKELDSLRSREDFKRLQGALEKQGLGEQKKK